MAYLMKIELLVDGDGSDDDMLAAEQHIRDLVSSPTRVLDSRISGCDVTAAELDDSIVNEGYESGDAFKPWVLFSPEKDAQGEGAFWSTQYGWDDLNLATRYEPFRMYPQDLPEIDEIEGAGPILIIDPSIPKR